jgi:sterol desaturase/sphingolipid hydroxylase (fatty acid hydroxylase superfamily)
VLVSPAYHRLHHDPDIQTANLGVVFTVWDVLAGFATFPSCHDAAGRTGADRTAGPGRAGRSPAAALLLVAGQLAEPFQARD